MRVCKVLCSSILAGMLFTVPVFSQSEVLSASSKTVEVEGSSMMVLSDALNAYNNADWKTSIFLFKKLHSDPANITPESLYMLIMAETYGAQYKQAVNDADLFLRKFPHSQYAELVIYQKGKNLFHINDYEKSIITLSDFCHTYPNHKLFAASLFWIAESFYASYNFENAKPLYERIIAEYSDDLKAKDAQYRLDVIAQRNREEKLLYLLRQTGEDYLSSRETYEKTLKQYQLENSVGVTTQMRDLRQQNEYLDSDLINEKKRTAELEAQLKDYEDDLLDSIKKLKIDAKEVYNLLLEDK